MLLVAALDLLIFRNLDRNSGFLGRSRLVVTEAVFGVLLAALAIELGILDIVMH